MGFGVWGLGFGVYGLCFEVWGLFVVLLLMPPPPSDVGIVNGGWMDGWNTAREPGVILGV